MIEKERIDKSKELIKHLLSPEGIVVNHAGRSFHTRDNASFEFTFPTLEDTIVILYAMFHHTDLYNPEFSVFNPRPSKPSGDFILPPDTYLWDEAKKMESMNLNELLAFSRDLVFNKGVPCIGVIGGLNGKDIVRVSIQVLYAHKFVDTFGGFACIGSITGGTFEKNKHCSKEFLTKLQSAVDYF